MNSKTVLLIKQLMDGKPKKPGALAELLEISPRLVRYEMGEADDFLQKENLPRLTHSRAEGIRLILNTQQQAVLKQKLATLDSYDYIMSSAERRCVMTLMLLASGDEPLTSQYFADQLGVSKSSSDKDLAQLKIELAKAGIRLDSKVGKGSTLVGDEQDLRNYAVKLLEHNMDFAGIYQGKADSSMVQRWADRLFSDGSFTKLFELVHNVEEEILGKWISYNSFRMLVLTLSVMLARIRTGKTLDVLPANMDLVKTTNDYVYAVSLSERLKQDFKVDLPQGEIYALAILLASVKYTTPECYLKEDWVSVQLLIDRLVHGMSDEMNTNFFDDEEIYNALQSHLGPTVFRLRHGIPITNPNLAEIKMTYPKCFNAMVRVLDQVQSELLRGITEDDIAYLVLYFCASIERSRRTQQISHVAIVCVHGAGTAKLLRELVCSRFKNLRVVLVTTRANVEALNRLNVDFVIASVPIPDCTLPWVQVDTVPTAENWEAIGQMIMKYSSWGKRNDSGSRILSDILNAVHSCCTVQDEAALEDALSAALESNGVPMHKDRVQMSLAQLLSENKVRCRAKAENWEEAIRQAGQILVDAGDATPEFVESALQSVRSAGPYIVIMPGVALVHSEVGKGVKHFAMSMVTFEDGVCFNHPKNDPVHILLCMAPIDSFSHIRALRGLLNLLDKIPVQTLCAAETPRELCAYLKGCCD